MTLRAAVVVSAGQRSSTRSLTGEATPAMTRHRADLLGPEQTALKYFLTSSEGERVCVSDSECVEYKTRRRDEMQQRQTEKDKVDG